MGLLKELRLEDSSFQPYINTGTLFDIQTGVFIPGTHNGMVLNGGLTTTGAVIGREQMFKSTTLLSYVMRAMLRYPQSECLVYDTEYAQKKDRLFQASGFTDYADFNERMVLCTPAEMTAEAFFEQVKQICAHKITNREKYWVDSPLVDPRSGKPLKMWIPTFVICDSWSKLTSGLVQTTLDTKQLGSSDTNMIFMKDGMIKKMMLSQLPRMATTAGVYFMLSAHVGNKFELNPYAASPKSLPYMKATDKPKEVGSDFNFLMSNYIEMRSVKTLLDADKECRYPTAGSSDTELNETISIMLRCKNNKSGTQLPMVLSQTKGILSDLSNYHYLKESDYFGLIGSKPTHTPAMTTVSLGRTTVRKELTDPKVARAVELLAQLCYIQHNWETAGGDVDFTMKPKLLQEKLLASDGPTTDDVLSSRGWWTYDKTNMQPYLSLYDVLAIAQGQYKAKGISLLGLSLPTTIATAVPVKKAK